MSNTNIGKQAAGGVAAGLVRDGMVVGIGTGSTVVYFIEALGRRVQTEGLKIRAIPTSEATVAHASRWGIPLVPLTPQTRPDLTIDGADEANPRLDLIKGGGGALLREKLVAAAAAEFVVIADSSKRVEHLGAFPLPLAVVPFAVPTVAAQLKDEFEVTPRLRLLADGEPYITDDGLYILDLPFGLIKRPAILDKRLKVITGVVETGIFIGLAKRLLLGHPDGRVENIYPAD
ncbi:ribose-5-phosphate isomerase RpiA [Armatimonas rosea]|uniref:Ribose-5-phosphate isomerase A n=1 Tax=Armatimonas rosea TaxID=685828 RepID=A0A7W9SM49_ARMRO|nr:ribose-5-phosphate isomerase RpiA [Armatimonas rosea]MBB6049176.1 ribose 5-phosphate isomerase A [Armatimonas rosea]